MTQESRCTVQSRRRPGQRRRSRPVLKVGVTLTVTRTVKVLADRDSLRQTSYSDSVRRTQTHHNPCRATVWVPAWRQTRSSESDSHPSPMRFESHFKNSFRNIKEYNLKNWNYCWASRCNGSMRPCSWGVIACKFLRQSQRQSCLWFVDFNSIPETSKNLVETCTQTICRGTH